MFARITWTSILRKVTDLNAQEEGIFTTYTGFCKLHFGAENGEEMLAAVDHRFSKLKELYPGMSVQNYDEANNVPFLSIVTPLMKRVHLMVRDKNY